VGLLHILVTGDCISALSGEYDPKSSCDEPNGFNNVFYSLLESIDSFV